MGRVKELLMEQQYEERDFRNVVKSILMKEGYSLISSRDPEYDDPDYYIPYDFKMGHSDGDVLVDVKIYRSNAVDPELISNALAYLYECAMREGVPRIMVVTNVAVEFLHRREGVLDGASYKVIGEKQLYQMADDLDDLAELYLALEPLTTGLWEPQATNTAPVQALSPAASMRSDFNRELAIKQLEECAEGDWQSFERACTYAIKGVFAKEFHRWTEPQHGIEDGYHRLDLMGLMNPTHDFWKGLRYDFRSRYIVFEFKNYKDPISQKEIYSTEKYLFAGALRMVAVMIARNGEDEGAKKARIGALREHGKLIMLLTRAELIQIVRDFRVGQEMYNVLIDNLHQMLSSIGR